MTTLRTFTNWKTVGAAGVALALAAAAIAPGQASAASVTIGSFGAGNCYPFECNDSGVTKGPSFNYFEIYKGSAVGALTFDTITFYGFDPDPGTVLSGTYDISFGVTSSPLGSNYPVPVTDENTFFIGSLAGQGPDLTITGTPFTFNPADGNLVMHIVATNQPNAPAGTNGFLWADYTGTDVTRAFSETNIGENDGQPTGALVTTFSAAAAAPEPGEWALMLLGIGLMGAALRGYGRLDKELDSLRA